MSVPINSVVVGSTVGSPRVFQAGVPESRYISTVRDPNRGL